MDTRGGPPWYAFSYRYLGAHGTFWLLLAAVIAMLWTWHGALVRVVDMDPEQRTVQEALEARDLHRWVVLPGARIVLDPALLGYEGSPAAFEPTTILVDPRDPAAEFWLRVQRAARQHASLPSLEPATATLDGPAGVLGRVAFRATTTVLESAYVAIRKDRQAMSFQDVLPRPQSAILLLGETAPSTSDGVAAFVGDRPPGSSDPGEHPQDGPRPPADGDAMEAYEKSLVAWRDVVLTHVSWATTRGLLDDAPRTLLERLERSPGIRLASRALRIDRKPSDIELYVFSGALLAFVFLTSGLYGVWVWQRDRQASAGPT